MAISEREQRGLAIAALCKIDKKGGVWLVPSQSGAGRYEVRHGAAEVRCTCPDFETRGVKCKHIYAVEYTIEREVHGDGSETLTKTMTIVEKVTYKQDWPAYNDAQSHEKERFLLLLADLCRGIPEPERTVCGRKPHPVKDAIFAMAYKVYSTFSSRRFSTDLRDAHARGFISSPIPGVKVTGFHENAAFTPVLKWLIVRGAAPLRTVERDFAIDSSGFSSSRFERWFDHKYGVTRQRCVWVKAHIACGVKTNVVTAVRILDKDAGDSPQFVPLVQETARTFTVGEVSADKAYGSVENFEEVAGFGGQAFIAFKSNATGAAGGMFEKMFHYFQFRREDFLAHYHKRSNVESTFSSIKRKFGDSVRSKTDAAMVNEVLCKILCHNICCVIQEQAELGIEPVFWQPGEQAPRSLLGLCNAFAARRRKSLFDGRGLGVSRYSSSGETECVAKPAAGRPGAQRNRVGCNGMRLKTGVPLQSRVCPRAQCNPFPPPPPRDRRPGRATGAGAGPRPALRRGPGTSPPKGGPPRQARQRAGRPRGDVHHRVRGALHGRERGSSGK